LFTLTSLFLSALANWRKLSGTAGRYVFCGTSRQPTLRSASRTLSGTLLCGVRTFLPHFLTKRERPSGPAAYEVIICDGDCGPRKLVRRWTAEGSCPHLLESRCVGYCCHPAVLSFAVCDDILD